VTGHFRVDLTFDSGLAFFTRGKSEKIRRSLTERTSVKDVIESCGVPHTEVDLIVIDSASVQFSAVLEADCEVVVYGLWAPNTFFPDDRLQARHLTRFVADGHLGKLTRRLRLLGLDVAYRPDAADAELVATSVAEERALLTRDRRLLMHRAVTHGYYLRSQNPEEQAHEIVRRFDLSNSFAPFTRCIRCNAMLLIARKSDVLPQLEPLTKKYYEEFRRCPACGRVYWPGSHFPKLVKHVRRFA
jgi:Uncharacterized conserved protein